MSVSTLKWGVALLSCAMFAQVSFAATGDYKEESRNLIASWPMPGTNISSPSGFGGTFGTVALGGGFVNRNRGGTDADGAIGFGGGVGNPQKFIGLDVGVSIFDLSGFARGGLSLKAHRSLGKGYAIAIGRENLATWGVTGDSASWYGTVSKIIFMRDQDKWFSALTLTAGAGNGRFRTVTQQNANTDAVNFFASAAVRVKEPVALITDWTGQDLNVGLSITPFRKFPIYLNPALIDVTRNAGDGIRFSMSAAVAYTFSSTSNEGAN